VRCIVCLKTGEWPSRLKDVAEIDVIESAIAQANMFDEESRKIAIERAHEIDETPPSVNGGRLEQIAIRHSGC